MGLFTKNRKETTIQKAHNLLDEYNALDKQHHKMLDEWQNESKKAKTSKERAKIDAKYEKLDREMEKKVDKPSDEYYYLMHKKFGNIDLKDYEDLPDKFMDKQLVERLAKRKSHEKIT